MALPLAAPLVLSAVRAVIRYRGRVDEVLSLGEAGAGLPFRLPEPPKQKWPHERAMLAFLGGERGTTLLELQGLAQDFKDIRQAQKDNAPRETVERQYDRCFNLYFEACEIDARVLLPGGNDAELRKNAGSGPSEEMRLAYYVVESDRLSRNTTLARLILATADTLLEFVGENAGAFVSNPRTRDLVQSLLEEFAGKSSFDDESAREIFRHLVGATALAVLEHPEILPNKPALAALYGAINDVLIKLKEGNSDQQALEAVFGLIQPEGFKRVVDAYLVRVAADPSFVAGSDSARQAISAVLFAMRGDVLAIFSDQAARTRALEALIALGADKVQAVLAREVAPGRPLSAAVLAAVAASVGQSARGHGLADRISRGELLGDLYGAALGAVAARGASLSTEAHVSQFVSEMVGALAGRLATVPVNRIRDPQTLEGLLAAALRVLAGHPATVAGNSPFASAVLAAALGAAADATADGLSVADAELVLDAALRSAGENAGVAGFGEAEAAALQSVTAALAAANLKELSSPAARKALLLDTLAAVGSSPKVWGDPGARAQLQPLVAALVEVARTGKARGLLAEPSMVEVVKRVLAAASRRARTLADGGADGVDDLRKILLKALEFADAELGRGVAHEDVPALLERVAQAFLKAPFAVVDAATARVDQLLRDVATLLEEAG